ncbi:MAG: ECF transporter S component [Clostridia bacterium]|nr:ECF transporter S component [Clostridia bacterium]
MKTKKYIRNTVISAMLFSLALVLPFFTGQIPKIGNMLLPMHLPIMFCGIFCGPWYGLAIGAAAPLVRSLFFGLPVFYPSAIAMALECATYGFFIGLLYRAFAKVGDFSALLALICSMLIGRAVWGCAMLTLLGLSSRTFTAAAFLSGAFVTALPGIIIQIVLIPVLTPVFKRLSEKKGK